MIRRVAMLLVAAALVTGVGVRAAVWDEPWHRDIVIGADTFGLFDTVSVTPFKTVFKRIRPLAGADTGETVTVDGFNGSVAPVTTMVRGGQNYDDEWTLRFRSGRRYYLFLKRASGASGALAAPAASTASAPGTTAESWRIATPTGGLAEVQMDGTVIATYRHSLHQGVVDPATFELTQTCIFDTLHKAGQCKREVYAFIDEQLAAAPASLLGTPSRAESERFFKQHAALETAYLVGYSVDRARLQTFLAAPFFHTQISAVRALARLDAGDRNAMLAQFVTDETRNPVARVFAVEAIRELKAIDLKERLTEYAPGATSEEVGLGARITDSRIGTRFPHSLRDALTQLLSEWK